MIVATAFASAAQSAPCSQAQLAGVWRAYSAGVDSGVSNWTTCRIVVNATGFIANTTCVNSFNQVGNLTNGRIVLSAAAHCSYSGGFTYFGMRHTVRPLTVSRDNLTAHGVGVFPRGSFIFTLVRI